MGAVRGGRSGVGCGASGVCVARRGTFGAASAGTGPTLRLLPRMPLIVAAVMALIGARAYAQEPAPPDTAVRGPEVEDVRFPGARRLDRQLLKDAIVTQETECRSGWLWLVCAVTDLDFAERKAYLDAAELERDRARLTWILRGKRVGFSLIDIREMLDLYDIGDQQQTQLRVTLDRCRQRIEALRRQKDDIDTTIAELGEFVTQLSQTVGDD